MIFWKFPILGSLWGTALRCAGAIMWGKFQFFENTLPILTYNTYDTILTKKNVHGQKIDVHGH